jgi:hypothetical protein
MALPDPQSASCGDDGRSRDRALIARIAAAERWARTCRVSSSSVASRSCSASQRLK